MRRTKGSRETQPVLGERESTPRIRETKSKIKAHEEVMKPKRRRRKEFTLEPLQELIEKCPVLGIIYGREILALTIAVCRAAERAKRSTRAKPLLASRNARL